MGTVLLGIMVVAMTFAFVTWGVWLGANTYQTGNLRIQVSGVYERAALRLNDYRSVTGSYPVSESIGSDLLSKELTPLNRGTLPITFGRSSDGSYVWLCFRSLTNNSVNNKLLNEMRAMDGAVFGETCDSSDGIVTLYSALTFRIYE